MAYKMLVTDAGKSAIAEAVANGTTIKLDQFAVGDGDGFNYTPDASMIKLVKEQWRGRIEQVTAEQNNQRKIVATIPADVGGFFMREIGIFDENGVLIAVGNTAVQYKPNPSEGMAKAIKLGLLIKVDNATAIELIVNEDLQAATKQDVSDAVKQHADKVNNPHNVTAEQVGLGNVDNTSDADKPISMATASVLAGKADATSLAPIYQEIDNIGQQLTTHIGDVNELQTTNKQIVAAINEVKQDGNNVKSNTVSALLSKDGSLPITQNSPWQDVITAIDNLSLGIDTSDTTALASHLLSGLTAYANGQKITGTMINRSVENHHQPTKNLTTYPGDKVFFQPPDGYYNGESWVYASAPQLVPGHILSGANILGVEGNIPIRGNEEYHAWRRAIVDAQPPSHGRAHFSIPTGAYLTTNPAQSNNMGIFVDDPNYIQNNIRSGVSIFGLVGTMPTGKMFGEGSAPSGAGSVNTIPLPFTPTIVVLSGGSTVGATIKTDTRVATGIMTNRSGTFVDKVIAEIVSPNSFVIRNEDVYGYTVRWWAFE